MKENNIEDRIEEKYTRYLNCETDTLELTIEEAIFILETDASIHYVENLLQEAYKVILSDYKRALKENEELKRLHIQDNKHLDFIMQYSITVQKVKDKIEEITKDKNSKYYYMFLESRDIEKTIQILQELIEEGE